jgi:hypothetical protein
VLVFGWKIVFGRAILSRNECKVQCVAQTCLEKGRAEEQVYGRVVGRKEEEGNKTGGGYSISFTARQITGEAARLIIMLASWGALEKRGLCVGNGV